MLLDTYRNLKLINDPFNFTTSKVSIARNENFFDVYKFPKLPLTLNKAYAVNIFLP